MMMTLLYIGVIIQIRFGELDCVLFRSHETPEKIEDISREMAKNVQEYCSCQFNSNLLLNSRFECIADSPKVIIFQAQLSGTNQLSAAELVPYIEQWVNSTNGLVVQGASVSLYTSCNLVTTDFESIECPIARQDQNQQKEDNEHSLEPAVIGGVLGGGLLVILIVIVIAAGVIVLYTKRQKIE